MKTKLSDKEQHEQMLDFIKSKNPNITFGVVFDKKEGRKHTLWCGSPEVCAFRISIKPSKLHIWNLREPVTIRKSCIVI